MCIASCAFGLRTDDVGGARAPPPTELVALFERHPQRNSEGVGQSVHGCLQFDVRSDLETSMDRLGITRAEVEKWDLVRLHILSRVHVLKKIHVKPLPCLWDIATMMFHPICKYLHRLFSHLTNSSSNSSRSCVRIAVASRSHYRAVLQHFRAKGLHANAPLIGLVVAERLAGVVGCRTTLDIRSRLRREQYYSFERRAR